MEEKPKQWLLVIISLTGMAIFCYHVYFKTTVAEGDYVNASELDDSPSRQEVLETKRKRERRFEYDRKVSSLEDFIGNEIEKDPMDTIIETDHRHIAEQKKTQKETSPVTIVKVIEVPVEVEKKEEVIRRTGFASDAVPKALAVEEEMPVTVVVHESSRVLSGNLLQLRTVEAVVNSSVHIAANTFLYGEISIEGERLFVEVSEIPGQTNPVSLEAFDGKGHRGVLISGGSEIHDEVAERTIGEIRYEVDIPILGDLPISAFRNKLKDRVIYIPAGLKLYLRKK